MCDDVDCGQYTLCTAVAESFLGCDIPSTTCPDSSLLCIMSHCHGVPSLPALAWWLLCLCCELACLCYTKTCVTCATCTHAAATLVQSLTDASTSCRKTDLPTMKPTSCSVPYASVLTAAQDQILQARHMHVVQLLTVRNQCAQWTCFKVLVLLLAANRVGCKVSDSCH